MNWSGRSPRATATSAHGKCITPSPSTTTLARPPADWLVLTRDYATQSGDTAALEPDNANGWYDREKEDLHLVVGTQSPQEVAAGAAAMLGKSRIGTKGAFPHPRVPGGSCVRR